MSLVLIGTLALLRTFALLRTLSSIGTHASYSERSHHLKRSCSSRSLESSCRSCCSECSSCSESPHRLLHQLQKEQPLGIEKNLNGIANSYFSGGWFKELKRKGPKLGSGNNFAGATARSIVSSILVLVDQD